MARKARHSLEPSEVDDDVLQPKHLTKQEFGRRLHKLMRRKGWNQSQLARAAFGTMLNENGAVVSRGRDSITHYIRGRMLPEPKNLGKLANALGVEPEELLPNSFESAVDDESPSLEIKQAHGQDRVWLRVNRAVSYEAATEIMAIINRENDRDDK